MPVFLSVFLKKAKRSKCDALLKRSDSEGGWEEKWVRKNASLAIECCFLKTIICIIQSIFEDKGEKRKKRSGIFLSNRGGVDHFFASHGTENRFFGKNDKFRFSSCSFVKDML